MALERDGGKNRLATDLSQKVQESLDRGLNDPAVRKEIVDAVARQLWDNEDTV